MSPEAFRVWGWRIPFLISIVLVAVGLYIRLKIEETPVFRQVDARNEQVRLPFVEALRNQWREVLLAGGTLTMLFGFFYIGSVYLTSYAGSAPGTGVLGLSRPSVQGPLPLHRGRDGLQPGGDSRRRGAADRGPTPDRGLRGDRRRV
ncbi:MAG: hypothetical protein QOI36_5765, partial [Pseudonocardiales bacterium]|nr:hypothetical protein [Pseudonocardiales bacterium]